MGDEFELEYDVQEVCLSKELVYKVTTVANEALPLEMLLQLESRREEISGQRLWEGSLLLCAHLLKVCKAGGGSDEQSTQLDLRGKTALELGAGTGLVSMLAHGLGAALVAVTDGDERCVLMADKNMKENNIPAAAAFVSTLRWGDSGSTLAFCKTYKRWATAAQRVFADQLRKGHASAPNSKMEPTLTERLESEPGINGVADDVRARPMAPLAGQEDPTIIPEHIATVTPDKMRNVLPREKRPALPPQGLFDFILAGDVLYKQTLLEPFLGTVEEMLAPNGRLLLCHVPRAGVTYDIVEDAFTRNRLAFTVVDGSKDKMEINGGRDDVGGVELCMDDARRARLYSVTRKS